MNMISDKILFVNDYLYKIMLVNNLRKKLSAIEHHSLDEDDYQAEANLAAVLAAFTIGEKEPHIILTQRSKIMRSHAGEVAFPGGKVDRVDKTLIDTALRESYEEIGLEPDQVELIGQVSPMDSRKGVTVQPIIGLIDETLSFQPCSEELDAVFKAPVSLFYDKKAMTSHRFVMQDNHFEMSAFTYQGFTIWGITAMIIINILNQVSEKKIEEPEIRLCS